MFQFSGFVGTYRRVKISHEDSRVSASAEKFMKAWLFFVSDFFVSDFQVLLERIKLTKKVSHEFTNIVYYDVEKFVNSWPFFLSPTGNLKPETKET